MSISNPQRFLRFAANHYELLLRLLDARELSEGELLQLARQHLADAEADPGKLVDQLLALGFLDRVPESDRFEIPLPIERFLRYLQREHHLTSPQQIGSYAAQLAELEQELQAAAERLAEGEIRIILPELADRIERLRHDVNGNKEAITEEVIHFRANRSQRPLRERYAKVVWLWERYLTPLQRLLDTEQVMERQLNSLERTLAVVEARLAAEIPLLAAETRSVLMRLYRMRRQIVADFRESMLELQPLYQRALHESRTARGASLLLERIRRQGLARLALDQVLRVPVSRHEGLFSDLAVKAHLFDLASMRPNEEVLLEQAEDQPVEAATRIDLARLLDELLASRPADVLAWLAERIRAQGGGIRDLLLAYGRAVRRLPTVAGAERRDYVFGDHVLTARVRAVGEAPEEELLDE